MNVTWLPLLERRRRGDKLTFSTYLRRGGSGLRDLTILILLVLLLLDGARSITSSMEILLLDFWRERTRRMTWTSSSVVIEGSLTTSLITLRDFGADDSDPLSMMTLTLSREGDDRIESHG